MNFRYGAREQKDRRGLDTFLSIWGRKGMADARYDVFYLPVLGRHFRKLSREEEDKYEWHFKILNRQS